MYAKLIKECNKEHKWIRNTIKLIQKQKKYYDIRFFDKTHAGTITPVDCYYVI